MSRDRLHRLLEELHRELKRAGTLDQATREEVLALAQAARARSTGAPLDDEEGLRPRLEALVQRFEASHPALARAVANLIDTLALYGL